jgi:hypothetical protein
MAATGRPTKYTPKLAKKICERIAKGETVRSICKDEAMPSTVTVYNWLLDEGKKEFLNQYEAAKNIQAELMFEELLEIADESSEVIVGDDKSDGARVQANRLRVDTRKWYLSKVLPKKFGEKLDMTTNGKEMPTTAPTIINIIKPDGANVSPEPETVPGVGTTDGQDND